MKHISALVVFRFSGGTPTGPGPLTMLSYRREKYIVMSLAQMSILVRTGIGASGGVRERTLASCIIDRL